MALLTNHIIGAVLAVSVAAPVVYSVSDREPCTRILSTRVVTPEVRPGHEFVIAYELQRAAVCHTTAQRIIFDGANVEHTYEADERDAFGPAVAETKAISVTVPAGATPGPARYRLILSFEKNWFQSIRPVVTIQPDVRFTILPPEKDNG